MGEVGPDDIVAIWGAGPGEACLCHSSAPMHCWHWLQLRRGVAAERCNACLPCLVWAAGCSALFSSYVMAAAVGILAAHCCHFKGAKKIIMVDSVPARLEVGLPVAEPIAALHQQHPFVLPSSSCCLSCGSTFAEGVTRE